jgi:hypothetical protein
MFRSGAAIGTRIDISREHRPTLRVPLGLTLRYIAVVIIRMVRIVLV